MSKPKKPDIRIVTKIGYNSFGERKEIGGFTNVTDADGELTKKELLRILREHIKTVAEALELSDSD